MILPAPDLSPVYRRELLHVVFDGCCNLVGSLWIAYSLLQAHHGFTSGYFLFRSSRFLIPFLPLCLLTSDLSKGE